MSAENPDGRVPEYQMRDANDRAERYQQKLAEAQAKYDKLAMRMAVDDALAPLDPSTDDIANLRAILEGANLRSDGDRVIIDFREGDNVLTISPQEAIVRMQASEAHACLFRREKPREPTRQEKAPSVASEPLDGSIHGLQGETRPRLS